MSRPLGMTALLHSKINNHSQQTIMEPGFFYNYKHAPTHLFVPGATYMLTAGTYNRVRFFNSADKKNAVSKFLHNVSKEMNWKIIAWVILDNHYHTLLTASKSGNNSVAAFVKKLHRRISINTNRLDNIKGRHVMENYWDKCITYEKSYWARLNYINNNPAKHGYVESASDYPFGSYYYSKHEEWTELEKMYPWDIVNEKDDF